MVAHTSLWLALLAATVGPAAAGAPAPLTAAWQDAAERLVNDANQAFAQAQPAPGANALEREMGEAVTLLNVQPRTEGNVARARAMLEKAAREAPAGEVSIFANYFLARVHESYEEPAEPDQARLIYRELIERYSGDSLAENSAARLVLMDLYANIPAHERSRRFVALEKLGAQLKSADGRRDYHLNMGNAYIDFEGSRASAIAHFLAAEAEGITHREVEAATWIAIGELARAEGRTSLARRYYGKFLAKYPRDNRHYTIQRRLEALPADPG